MGLEPYRKELQELGFAVVRESEFEVVALLSKRYWSRLATRLVIVVFLRSTGPLDAGNIAAESERMLAEAAALDGSAALLGFGKARLVMPVYVADSVSVDARAKCSGEQPLRLSEYYFPAAFDRSTGEFFYLQWTPPVGAALYTTPRFIIRRLFEPETAPKLEPISRVALAVNVLLPLLLVFMIFIVLRGVSLLAAH